MTETTTETAEPAADDNLTDEQRAALAEARAVAETERAAAPEPAASEPPGTAVATRGRLGIEPGQRWWDSAQLAALRTVGLEDTPDPDLVAFLHRCQRSGLDPFLREIYLIGRKDRDSPGGKKWTPQVGIDGFRLIGERTGEYLGELGPEWCGPDGVWLPFWPHEEPPVAARVAVLRAGFPQPMWGTAMYREFVATRQVWEGNGNNRRPKRDEDGKPVMEITGLWATMPAHMLAKCAEALAFRKAFPRQAAGIYAPEEMARVDEAAREAERHAAAEERARARAAYAARPWDPAGGPVASPAITAPGDVVEGQVIDAEMLPTADDLRTELAEAAEILGTTVPALSRRWAKAHRKNVEDGTADELAPLVESLRGQVAEALARLASPPAADADGDAEADEADEAGPLTAPTADIDAPHPYRDWGGVCVTCTRPEGDPRHAPV